MIIGLFNGGRPGVVDGDLVYDVSGKIESATRADGPIAALIRAGVPSFSRQDLEGCPTVALADAHFEAPLPRPGKIMGAPANYFDHADEMPNSATIVEWGLFLKAGTSVIGPDGTVRLPYTDQRTDYEGELAVVIGVGGRNISVDDALGHVYGYTCILDITVRSSEDRSTRKSFDSFSPLGPWIVTADEIVEPGVLDLQLTVNGETKQHTSTAKLIYGVEELIAYASSVMTLEPGDVIATGTPAGVGPIVDGDSVTVTIERVGALTVSVSGAEAIAYSDRPGPKTALQRQ